MSALQPDQRNPRTLLAVMCGGHLVLAYTKGAEAADLVIQAAAVQVGPASLRLLAAAAIDAAERIEQPTEDPHAP